MDEGAPRLHRWLPWLLGAALVALMVWPWPLHPLHTLGAPDVEADNHLWMLWRAVQQALGAPGPFVNWPVGEPRPLMDLVHLPLALLGMSAHPGLGYGLIAVADAALAAAGGWWIAREAGASRRGALVGMAVLGSAPVLAGLLVHGLTEDWPVGLYALHVAALLRTARTGSWRSAVASGLCLSGYALAGWYAALFAAAATPAVLLWAWRAHRPGRRAWALVGLAGLGAVLVVSPVLAWFLSHADLGEIPGRWMLDRWSLQEGWWSGTPPPAPPWGADPVSLIVPNPLSHPMPRTVYLGVVALVLAAAGAWRRPEARWPVVGLGLLAFLALGHHLVVGGRPWFLAAPLPGPGTWLAALAPPLRAVAGWYRAVAPAMVFLAAAAALGAEVVLRERGWRWFLGLSILVVVDATLLCDAPWPRPIYDPRPPAELIDVPGKDALLLLPVDRGQTAWSPRVPRLYQRWQPWLGRPITEAYEGPEALGEVVLVRWLASVCDGPAAPGLIRAAPQEMSDDVAHAGWVELGEVGVGAIAVVRWRVQDPDGCVRGVSEHLGTPHAGEEITWWRLSPPR